MAAARGSSVKTNEQSRLSVSTASNRGRVIFFFLDDGQVDGVTLVEAAIAGQHLLAELAGRGVPPDFGLGLLDVATQLTGEKALRQVDGACLTNGAPFQGYEMHVGETAGPDCARPLMRFTDGRLDGAISADGLVAGAYVHGLFADDRQRAAWLALFGGTSGIDYEATIERALDALADHCEAHLDCDGLLAAAR